MLVLPGAGTQALGRWHPYVTMEWITCRNQKNRAPGPGPRSEQPQRVGRRNYKVVVIYPHGHK